MVWCWTAPSCHGSFPTRSVQRMACPPSDRRRGEERGGKKVKPAEAEQLCVIYHLFSKLANWSNCCAK